MGFLDAELAERASARLVFQKTCHQLRNVAKLINRWKLERFVSKTLSGSGAKDLGRRRRRALRAEPRQSLSNRTLTCPCCQAMMLER